MKRERGTDTDRDIENVKVDMSYAVAYCLSSLSSTARTYIIYERTIVTNDLTYHFYHT